MQRLQIVRIRSIGDAIDSHGHGSHVMGTIAGEAIGTSAAPVLDNNGVAPKAKLFVSDISAGTGGVLEDVNWPDYYQIPYNAGAR